MRGKVEKLSDCLTKDGCEKIIQAAPFSTKERIKTLVSGGIDLIAKEAQYHKSCRRDFFKEMDSQGISEPAETSSRKVHSETFNTIAELIQNEIISKGHAMFVSFLYDLYKAEYLGNGGTAESIGSYTTQALFYYINLITSTLPKSLLVVLKNYVSIERNQYKFVFVNKLH